MWHLPPESALARSYLDGQQWTNDTELLATIADLMYEQIRVDLAVAGAKKHQLPKFEQIRRPWQEHAREKAEPPTVEELAALFGGGDGMGLSIG